MVHQTKRNFQQSKLHKVKLSIVLASMMLVACATPDANYLQYLDQTSKLAASQNAAEAACLLVIAEGMKNSDSNSKAILSSQIDKCKKDPIKLVPPKNWLGL